MLWIRSQNKKRLVPADKEIDYLKIRKEGQIIKCKIYCGEYQLGEYETEDRYVQILNEIQEALMLPSMEDGMNLYENNVYEMPEQ